MTCRRSVGAASGEITRFIARKYGMRATALDVAAPENNSFASYKQRADAWPIKVFDGAALPVESGSYDVVLFVYSLHHAATNAPALLREAARVAASTIIVVEACDVLVEARDAAERTHASELRSREFACMGDRQAVFRSQAEWTALIEQSAAWRVTHVGAVREGGAPGDELAIGESGHRPLAAAENRRFFVARKQRAGRRRRAGAGELENN